MTPLAQTWNDSTIPTQEELDATLNGEADDKRARAAITVLPLARKLSDLARVEHGDPDELLAHRYLCRCGGLLLCGPTGIGKSAFSMQCALLWAIGKPCLGVTPARPLRSLIIQAENDDGDLADMRDGVIKGLSLTPEQARVACENVIVCREDSRCGDTFFDECVRPLLAAHNPDLLWIEPALAYLGGEANSQRDVGGFLRNRLNPLLREFRCAAIVVHHTNKPPSGREKPDWSGTDFAYLGSGSAEWANWARAVLGIRTTGQDGIFELRAGKRGARLGWKDPEGNTVYAKCIGHALEPGVICWREVDQSGLPKPGRPNKVTPEEIFELLPEQGLRAKDWLAKAAEETGVSETTFHTLRRKLKAEEKVLKSKIDEKWKPIHR